MRPKKIKDDFVETVYKYGEWEIWCDHLRNNEWNFRHPDWNPRITVKWLPDVGEKATATAVCRFIDNLSPETLAEFKGLG